MLKHVVERKILDHIVDTVNVVVAKREGGLDDESRWVASLARRGVVRAGVTALSLDPRDLAVLPKELV